MLTVEKLKAMQPGEIFASGECIDDGKEICLWKGGHRVQWVAVRGKGYHDRAIYAHIVRVHGEIEDIDFRDYYGEWNNQRIADVGDKIHDEVNIRKLVDCDDESFNLYRY